MRKPFGERLIESMEAGLEMLKSGDMAKLENATVSKAVAERLEDSTSSIPTTTKETDMRKVVINVCYGGFSLSHKAVMRYAKLAGISLYAYKYGMRDDVLRKYQEGDSMMVCYLPEKAPQGTKWEDVYKLALDERKIKRSDPALVQAVEELGKEANGECADLKVVELGPNEAYRITMHDGYEELHTSAEWEF